MKELASALGGRYSIDLPGGVHLRSKALPWGIPSTVMTIEGELFVYWDPDQPLAHRHALELVRRHAAALLGYLGEVGELLTPPGRECEFMVPLGDAPAAVS